MDKKVLRLLIDEYKRLFSNISERSGFEYRKYHGLRVLTYCCEWVELPFLNDKEINRDALMVASLFHDIGKIRRVNADNFMIKVSDDSDNHGVLGSEIIDEYIGKYFEDKNFIKKVSLIIKEHCGDEVLEYESHILRDADLFDKYGFVQVTRMVAYGERNGRNVEGMLERWTKVERGGFEKNLGNFYFEEVRNMARERLKKLDDFFDDLSRDNTGYLQLIS